MFLGVKIWDLNTPKMVAINYICTPIKCNHCTLGEENQRYSSLVSYIDIKKLNSKICLQQFICILSVACGPWLARPTCQWLWMGITAVLPVSFRNQTASSSSPFAFLPLHLIHPLTNGGFSPSSSRQTPPHRVFLGIPVTI